MKISSTKINKLIKTLLAVAFWICVWAIVSRLIGKELILPSPQSAALALWDMILTGGFYANVLATLYRVLAGIVLSFSAGFLSALLAYYVPGIRELLKPMVSAVKTTPVLAVIIFGLLWFTSGNVPIFACFLMCYPVIYTNLLTGLYHTDKSFLEMAKMYKVPGRVQIRHIYVPSVMPYIKSGMSLICGLSWKSVVAAEVLSGPQFSMGYRMWDSKVYLETDQLFAWVIAIVALSIFFERFIKYIISGKAVRRLRTEKRKRKVSEL